MPRSAFGVKGWGPIALLVAASTAVFLIRGAASSRAKGLDECTRIGDADFGLVYTRQELKQTFVVRNEDSEPWTVTRLWATCGCVHVTTNLRDIKPGDDLRVTVALGTSSTYGKQNHVGYVSVDRDGTPQTFCVRVKAELRDTIRVEPATTLVRCDPGSGRFQARVSALTNGDKSPVLVAKSEEGLKVVEELVVQEDGRIALECTVTGALVDENRRKFWLKFRASSLTTPRGEAKRAPDDANTEVFRLFVVRKPTVSAVPSTVVMVPERGLFRGRVQLVGFGTNWQKALTAKSVPSGRVGIETTDNGVVTLTVEKETAENGAVVVQLSTGEVIRIPVSCVGSL